MAAAALAGCVLLASWGCAPRPRPRPAGYFGPTESLNAVVTRINANNQQLSTLWMRHSFGAAIVEATAAGKTRTTKIDGRGVLMYQAPDKLFMNGTHPLGGKLFELGCNDQAYWVGVPQEKVDTIWHGRMEHLGKPCVEPIPLRPDLLVEVLGVSTFDPNLARFPAPVMKFNNDADAYMFTWVMPHVDRFVAVKEVWYDRKTLRPRLVNLFGDEGRILLRAYLSRHIAVEIDGADESQRPTVPGRYELLYAETGSRMTIEIDEARLSYRGAPDARAFRRPNLDLYAHQRQLDEACVD